MMAAILSVLLIVLLQVLTSAWWWILLIPLVYGFFQRGYLWRTVFLEGGLVATSWLLAAVWQWTTAGERIVHRVAVLIGVPGGWVLLLLSVLLAFIAAGMATFTGISLRQLVWKDRQLS